MPGTIVTIGNFDGVHLGHRALLETARGVAAELTGATARVVALAFDPHPATRLRPEAAPALLTPWDARAALLKAAGADHVVRLDPTAEFLTQRAADFIAHVVAHWQPGAFVEGADFHFGHARGGNVHTLAQFGATAPAPADRFAVYVVPPVETALGDHTLVRVSSSLVRWLLAHGRAADAARLLGRPYELAGLVRRGDQRGRTIGFPTANLHLTHPVLLPADGVYAALARATWNGVERSCAAALNIGLRPTVNGTARTIEAHLLDPAALAGFPEYGWSLSLGVSAWLRDQVRFAGLPELTAQLRRDVAHARALLPRP